MSKLMFDGYLALGLFIISALRGNRRLAVAAT